MIDHPPEPLTRRPMGVSLIAIVNALALLVTLVFWGVVITRRLVPFPGDLIVASERATAATTYGFMVGDIIWSAPLLALAAVGVWRRRFWGWTAAQMANVLWVYSMTVVWARDLYTKPSPGGILFLPFTLFAVWASIYLWRHRTTFVVPSSTA